MPGTNDLTNLQSAVNYVLQSGNAPSAQTLSMIAQLITRVSQQVIDYCSRDFASRTVTETNDGTGTEYLPLRRWPVTSVSKLVVDNITIPAVPVMDGSGTQTINTTYGYGYDFQAWSGNLDDAEQQFLKAVGFIFPQPRWTNQRNVAVTYTAGFLTTEAWTCAASITPNQNTGTWIADGGVTYASSGVALTKVASNPGVGQYSVTPIQASGSAILNGGSVIYSFNAGDVGTGINLAYSFVPPTVEQVVLDLINLAFSLRQRPGSRSRSLAGQESATYDSGGLPDWARLSLNAYKRVTPW